MVAAAIVLIGWDLYVANNDIMGDTISALIYEASLRLSFLSYAAGVIMAHLFFPRHKQKLTDNNSTKGLLICFYVGGGLLVLDFVNITFWKQEIVPLLALIFGSIMGHIFWLNNGKAGE